MYGDVRNIVLVFWKVFSNSARKENVVQCTFLGMYFNFSLRFIPCRG